MQPLCGFAALVQDVLQVDAVDLDRFVWLQVFDSRLDFGRW